MTVCPYSTVCVLRQTKTKNNFCYAIIYCYRFSVQHCGCVTLSLHVQNTKWGILADSVERQCVRRNVPSVSMWLTVVAKQRVFSKFANANKTTFLRRVCRYRRKVSAESDRMYSNKLTGKLFRGFGAPFGKYRAIDTILCGGCSRRLHGKRGRVIEPYRDPLLIIRNNAAATLPRRFSGPV